ncbi:MAG: FAD:protein FMN transferase [Pseudomonadota bacterium]
MITRRSMLAGLASAIAVAGCTRAQSVEREWLIYTTLLKVRATAADQATANTCCQRVFDTIQTQGPDLYGFGDGELSRANTALSQGQSVELSDRLYDLLRRADVWRVASGGRFDPAVGGMVAAWGFDDLTRPQTGGVPDQAAIDRMIAATTTGYTFGGSRDLQSFDPAVRLDIGAIVKGALLAEAIAAVADNAVERLVVDLGGDVAVQSMAADDAFRVAVANPSGGPPSALLTMRSGEYVMTSGGYARYREIDGERYQHIIDPRSGWPVPPAAATVIGDDPVHADAAATALVVGGPKEFSAVCDAMGVDKALLIDNLGTHLTTASMRERLI